MASGDLVRSDREHPDFDGSVVALGRLGVAVALELDVVPTFALAQTVVDGLPDARVADELEAILGAAYSASVFTTWGRAIRSTACQRRTLPSNSARPVLGTYGLHHFRLEFTPRRGDELQSEYLLP